MGPIVRDHKGFIDKFIGDAIMALLEMNLKKCSRCGSRNVERFRQIQREHRREDQKKDWNRTPSRRNDVRHNRGK